MTHAIEASLGEVKMPEVGPFAERWLLFYWDECVSFGAVEWRWMFGGLFDSVPAPESLGHILRRPYRIIHIPGDPPQQQD